MAGNEEQEVPATQLCRPPENLDLRRRGEIDEAAMREMRRARYTVDQVLGDWFPAEPPPARTGG